LDIARESTLARISKVQKGGHMFGGSSTEKETPYFDWVGCDVKEYYRSRLQTLEAVARGRIRDEAERKKKEAELKELKDSLSWVESGLHTGSADFRAYLLDQPKPVGFLTKIKIFFSKLLTSVS